jgi:DNA mismatch repair ATPase MutS
MIITGPNASGKTTVLKSALINVILSQQFGCGFYDEAVLKPYKFIHCYLNIPDTSGRDSLFQAEARRCKEIIDTIKENNGGEDDSHFCVFDEIYSGTNPEEAVISALAFMQYLVKIENVQCIMTTHFIKVCKKLNKNKRVKNYHMHVDLSNNNDFSYTYKMKEGISEIHGGIKVLNDMNYPTEIINNTRNKINQKNSKTSNRSTSE